MGFGNSLGGRKGMNVWPSLRLGVWGFGAATGPRGGWDKQTAANGEKPSLGAL